MKKLLRERKSSISSKSKPVVSAPAPLASAETPLYTRFATTQQGQDGQSRPAVSGPTHLSSKTSFSRSFSLVANRGTGQERHSQVLSRKSSRQDEVQSTSKVLSSLPARSSSRVTATAGLASVGHIHTERNGTQQGRTTNEHNFETEVGSSNTQLYSRIPGMTAFPPGSSQTTFPRMYSYESQRQDGLTYPEVTSSRTQLPELPDKTDSLDSDSDFQPPRPLVVRNRDPETSSATSLSSAPKVPVSSTAGEPPSAQGIPIPGPSHYNEIHHTDGAANGHVAQFPPSYVPDVESRHSGPASTVVTSRLEYPTASSIATSYTPNDQEQQPKPVPPKEFQAQVASFAFDPVQRTAAPTLLATPSIIRKRYSPLAAFGLPVGASTSVSASSSIQAEPVSAGPSFLRIPSCHVDFTSYRCHTKWPVNARSLRSCCAALIFVM